MSDIYKNFADGLPRLSQKTAAHSTVSYGTGKRPGLYAGPVHLKVIAENLFIHSRHMEAISQNPSLLGGIYAGAAGFINMGYMAHSRSSGAILYDINTYQSLFWKHVIQNIMRNENPAHFREALIYITSTVKSDAAKKYAPSLRQAFETSCGQFGGSIFKDLREEDIVHWVQRGSKNTPEGQWMHDEKLYAHIYMLAVENAVGAITLDITSGTACDAVRDYLVDRGVGVRLLYNSNILNFMQSPVRSTDFVGRRLSDGMQRNAQDNLFGWMEKSGHIIECDNLERNTPLLITAKSYGPRTLGL